MVDLIYDLVMVLVGYGAEFEGPWILSRYNKGQGYHSLRQKQ